MSRHLHLHLARKCPLLTQSFTRSFSTRPRIVPSSSSTSTWNIRPITSHQVSPRRPVPSHIVRPNYVDTTIDPAPTLNGNHIQIHDATAITKMRHACRIAALVRTYAGTLVKPGVTTDSIDAAVHAKIIEYGAYPTPLGFYGFPKSVCTSINQVACHGIPDSRPLENGDIINIDVSVYIDGYHGDCSGMFVAGTTDAAALLLIKHTYECMNAAIERCAPGMPFSMIGNTIHEMAERWGKTIAWGITGHGIGQDLHMAPLIYHCRSDIQQTLFPYAPKGHMQPGMTFTIEPILFEGSNEIYTWPDGWTIASKDQSRSAQWEETVLITENGHEILTRHE